MCAHMHQGCCPLMPNACRHSSPFCLLRESPRGHDLWSTTAVEEEFWLVMSAVSLSDFWAWVNCRVLKWINLVTLKPFFRKTRKRIWYSHPNQQESCIHCRMVSLLKMRMMAIVSQRQETQTLSSLPVCIWQPKISTFFSFSFLY